jgi:hypothetical protein
MCNNDETSSCAAIEAKLTVRKLAYQTDEGPKYTWLTHVQIRDGVQQNIVYELDGL